MNSVYRLDNTPSPLNYATDDEDAFRPPSPRIPRPLSPAASDGETPSTRGRSHRSLSTPRLRRPRLRPHPRPCPCRMFRAYSQTTYSYASRKKGERGEQILNKARQAPHRNNSDHPHYASQPVQRPIRRLPDAQNSRIQKTIHCQGRAGQGRSNCPRHALFSLLSCATCQVS